MGELTGIKDWSRWDLEVFSKEAYVLLKDTRERLSMSPSSHLVECTGSVTRDIMDFLTEWEMPLEDD